MAGTWGSQAETSLERCDCKKGKGEGKERWKADEKIEAKFRTLVEGLPTAKLVFVDFHVDSFAAKVDTFQVEPEALFCCGLPS